MRENPWMARFLLAILDGSKPVLALMEPGPFGLNPPKFVRAMVYQYRFTTIAERRATGDYWKRELRGTYFPPAGLRSARPRTLQ